MGTPEPKRQDWCRVCETLGPNEDMQPIGREPFDLDAMLSGRWMCRDEKLCLARYAARSKGDAVMLAVIMPADPVAWAGGTVLLYTANPRHAEQHAAAYRACVVPLRIRTDYREDRT